MNIYLAILYLLKFFLKGRKKFKIFNFNLIGKLLLFLLSFYTSFSFAQFQTPGIVKTDTLGFIKVNGLIEKNNKPLENASIIVYKNNKKIAHLRTPPNGRFNLNLEYNKYYKIEITKMGMVTKKFEFDTNLPAGIPQSAVFPFDFTIVLFPKYNYIDMSILDKPLAIIRYDKKYEDYFYDYNYAKTINDKVIYIQNKIEELTREYSRCVDEGRKLLEVKDYRPSLVKFERAHDIFPDEPYPIEKIALIKKILNEKKTKKEIYEQIIADAEKKVDEEEYERAIDLLGQAMQVLPAEKFPAMRIKEIRYLMEKFAIRENKYRQLIEKADLAFDYNRFKDAKLSYSEASTLFPRRTYPKDRIIEINKILAAQPDVVLAYNNNISKADKLLLEKDYNKALEHYNQANKLQPDDKYAKDKIAEVNKIINSITRTEEEYNKALTEANKNFISKNYEKAKTFFKIASNLKPDEKYPKSRLMMIDSLMTFAAENDMKYNNLINQANLAYNNKNYSEAKQLFQKASEIRPYEILPKDKIIGINNTIKLQNEIKAKYEQAIKQADKLYNAKNLDDAKQFYQVANNINPDEEYAVEKIISINKETNNNEALQQNYKSIIDKADKLFKSEYYEKSLAHYQLALRIMPEEKYPKNQIDEINKIYMSRLNKDELYIKTINEGDKYILGKLYQEAIAAFNNALSIKPDEKYPRERIEFINKKLSELIDAEELYRQTIAIADKEMADKKYENAKNEYLKANKIKPLEPYPKERIAEVNQIINNLIMKKSEFDKIIYNAERYFYRKDYLNAKTLYEEAIALLPDEQLPKEKIKEIDKLMAEIDFKENAYAFSVNTADSLYKMVKLEDALTYYKQANKLKPSEIHPQTRIQEINKIFADTKSKEDNFSRTILEADRMFNTPDFTKAIELYKTALIIKPEEKYPQNQIALINEMIAKKAKIDSQYSQLINDADKLFKDRELSKAKLLYNDALSLKPDETYPREKISSIDKTLEEEKIKLDTYWKMLEEADEFFDLQNYEKAKILYTQATNLMPNDNYPKEKIAEINNILLSKQTAEESYSKMLLVADRTFSSKDYEHALELYKKALEIKSEEKYPKQKIIEIEEIIKGFEANKNLYSLTLRKADDLYELKQYREARDLYKKARDLYPIQKYPRLRISTINDILREEEYAKAIGDISKELIEKRTEKKFTFNPITDKRGNNYVLIEAKNLSSKPYKVLVYYGKDDERSGGLVTEIQGHDRIEKYVVRVGTQDNWFKIQNNWISIQPLGGDIEVYSIQILQGN